MSTRKRLEDLIVGESYVMRELRAEIAAVAPSDLSILVEGETGTGKELVAEALHELGGRSGSFVPVNVCAIGEQLFEGEMFGHVRGAFTGAYASRVGRVEEANSGTLFLDEVGDLAMNCQAKLLRTLEAGVVRPVGGTADRRVEVRFVAASNRDLSDLVAQGAFRADLAFRLGQWRLRTPPLRERPEDIPLLVQHFLRGMSLSVTAVSGKAVEELAGLDWVGNVRQLRSFVHALVALRGGTSNAGDVRSLWVRHAWRGSTSSRTASDRASLCAALERHRGRKDLVARELGIHLSTLYRWLARLGVDTRRERGPLRRGESTSQATAS